MRYIIFTLSALMLVIGCKKKDISVEEMLNCTEGLDSVNTYFDDYGAISSEYLAAYPGSWWVFSTGDTLRCVASTNTLTKLNTLDSNVCEASYNIKRFFGAGFSGGITMNPDFFGGIVSGDYAVIINNVTNSIEHEERRILNTSYINDLNDTSWIVSEENGDGYSRIVTRKLKNFHTTWTLPNGDVYENVAEIQQNFEYISDSPGTSFNDSTLFYYAKEIGLIMTDHFEFPITDVHVVDYYIAPH